MNARLYDPVLGRFLTPDPIVTDPSCSLDFNRYMYARNNPMLYTDESGESWKSFWQNFAAAWKRDWSKFIGGFDGGTVGFSTSGRVSFTPNYYGRPVGPAVGLDFNKNQATFGGYQNGFFNMQSVNYEKNLQQAVIGAETKARYEYFANKVSDMNQEIGYDIKTLQMIDKMSAAVDLVARDEFRMLKNIDAPGFRFNVGLRKVVGNSFVGYGLDGTLLYFDYNDYRNGEMETDEFYYNVGSTVVSTVTSIAVAKSMFYAGAVAAGSCATISSTLVGASFTGYYMGYKWFKDYMYPEIYYRFSNLNNYIINSHMGY